MRRCHYNHVTFHSIRFHLSLLTSALKRKRKIGKSKGDQGSKCQPGFVVLALGLAAPPGFAATAAACMCHDCACGGFVGLRFACKTPGVGALTPSVLKLVGLSQQVPERL